MSAKKPIKYLKNGKNNQSQFDYPPYIAYLALFVLAVNHDNSSEGEDFLERAYYPRLKSLMGECLSTPDFERNNILDLWENLEHWTLKDKKSKFGEFHLDIYGNRLYVGILYYQVVIRKRGSKTSS